MSTNIHSQYTSAIRCYFDTVCRCPPTVTFSRNFVMQILDSFDCFVVAYAENLILVYKKCFCFSLFGLNIKLMNLAPSSIDGPEIPDAQPYQVQMLNLLLPF